MGAGSILSGLASRESQHKPHKKTNPANKAESVSGGASKLSYETQNPLALAVGSVNVADIFV